MPPQWSYQDSIDDGGRRVCQQDLPHCRGMGWQARCWNVSRDRIERRDLLNVCHLRVVDEEIDVGPGSIISVDHGEEHQFVNIAEDLELLVVFAPPDQPDED